MEAAAIALAVAGPLMSASSQYESSRFNARVARENAQQAEADGVAEAAYIRDRGRRALGAQAAAQAESGFMPNIGSAADALEESAIEIELSMAQARRQARSQSRAYHQRGALAKHEGDSALIEGLFSAANGVFSQQADYAADRKSAGYSSG